MTLPFGLLCPGHNEEGNSQVSGRWERWKAGRHWGWALQADLLIGPPLHGHKLIVMNNTTKSLWHPARVWSSSPPISAQSVPSLAALQIMWVQISGKCLPRELPNSIKVAQSLRKRQFWASCYQQSPAAMRNGCRALPYMGWIGAFEAVAKQLHLSSLLAQIKGKKPSLLQKMGTNRAWEQQRRAAVINDAGLQIEWHSLHVGVPQFFYK